MPRMMIASLTALAFLLAPNLASAGETPHLITGGFKTGLNLGEFGGNDASAEGMNPSYRVAFQAGAFLTYQFAQNLAVQPELYYTQKGCTYEEGDAKVIFKLDYLELPLLLKYMVVSPTTLVPNFFGGPTVAIKLNSQLKAESGSDSEHTDLGNVRSMDFGVVLGAGLDLPAGQGVVTFDIRYTLGLSGLADNADEDGDVFLRESSELKNRVLSLMMGYSF